MSRLKALVAMAGLLAIAATGEAQAQGDPAKGEKEFNKCKACHMIANGDNVIVKGGKTGPNLFGIIGRVAGTFEGFKYGESIVAAGEKGLVWDAAQIQEYVKDPKAFLANYLGESAVKTKMTFKLARGGEDVAAFLASVASTN
ncbi:MAG TPA: cytochrome C [Paracoccaceae bacterium]|nr:cytochrome C [Paracoccaceae bacterium]